MCCVGDFSLQLYEALFFCLNINWLENVEICHPRQQSIHAWNSWELVGI
jgi:hypothetical protein